MYKYTFHNFGVISFINKEMVLLFQLHTYKFGLVYILFASVIISAVRYIQENQILQVLTLFLSYTLIVIKTYRFDLHFDVAAVDCKMKPKDQRSC